MPKQKAGPGRKRDREELQIADFFDGDETPSEAENKAQVAALIIKIAQEAQKVKEKDIAMHHQTHLDTIVVILACVFVVAFIVTTVILFLEGFGIINLGKEIIVALISATFATLAGLIATIIKRSEPNKKD